jgi:predicted metal-dependent peptidase
MLTIEKLKRARVAMLQSQRFWGKLCLDLELVEDASIKTAEVDGKHLFYNPEYIDSLSEPQARGLCAHETAHVAQLHHLRRKGRDPEKWNKACDYAINPMLLREGFELPEGALTDVAFEGKSAEAIYAMLPDPDEGGGEGEGEGQNQGQPGGAGQPGSEKGEGGGQGQGEGQGEQGADGAGDPSAEGEGPGTPPPGRSSDPGKCGGVRDQQSEAGEELSPSEIAEAEADQQMKVAQAANFAKQAGQGSSDQARVLDELKRAQEDWVTELRQFFLARVKDDTTWSRPNKRMLASAGVYLPSAYSERMEEIVIAIDLSGSCSPYIKKFMGEMQAIKEDVRPKKMTIIYFADGVTGVDEFEDDDELVLKPRGAGGTSFAPIFAKIEELGIEPSCCVILTDLCGEAKPAPQPNYPVLWAATTSPSEYKEWWGDRINLKL